MIFKRNGLMMGLCSVIGFVIAANSFVADVFSNAQVFTWLISWVQTSGISTYLNQLIIRIETIFDVLGFWFVFLPIAFLIWRNHERH